MIAPLRVLLLDTKTRNPNHYICLSIARALQRHPDVEAIVLCTYGDAIEKAYAERCNLFVAFDGETLNRAIVQRLGMICGRSILWVTEDPYEGPENVKNSDFFDLVFTNDEGSVPSYGAKGRYLPFAADESLHRFDVVPFGDARLRYDISFVGSAWPNRVQVIRSLLREFPDLRWKLALPSNEHLPPFSLPMPESSYTYRTSPTEFARIANASRIVLGLHRSFTTSPGAIASTGSPPPRLFEAALAGTAQICDSSISSLHEFYEADREVLVYSTFRQLCECITKVRASPKLRDELARAAQQRTITHNLYDNRVSVLIDAALRLGDHPRRPVASRRSVKPVLLQVVHNTISGANYGGVEVYLRLINRGLSRDFNVFTLSYDQAGSGNDYALFDGNQQLIRRTSFDGAYQQRSLSIEAKEQWFSKLLVELSVDIAHFQHLLGYPMSLPIIAKALGIRVAVTLHDYWGICDSFNLLDERERFCRIDERDSSVCDPCTRLRHGRQLDGYQRSRRQFFGEVLRSSDAVVVNTEDTARRYGQFFAAELSGRLHILPVPLPNDVREWGKKIGRARHTSAQLRVALLGNVSKAKGFDSAVAALRVLAEQSIEFTVLGRLSDDAAADLAKLGNVRVVGAYRVSELPTLLAEVDVTLHLSIWPETYCMSLSEAWACGCVPVASNIGALAERITDGFDGFLVAPDDPHDLVRVLRKLALNRPEVERVRSQITGRLSLSEDGHLDRLSDLYAELLFERVAWPSEEERARPLRGALTLFDCGIALTGRLQQASGVPDDAASSVDHHADGLQSTGAPGTDFVFPRPFGGILENDPAYVIKIDEFKNLASQKVSFTVGDVATIRGWAARSDTKTPVDVRMICLRSVVHDSHYVVPVTREERVDVAAAWGAAQLKGAGFRQTFCLELDAGAYEVAAIDERGGTNDGPRLVIDVFSRTRPLRERVLVRDLAVRGALDRGESLQSVPPEGEGDVAMLDGWIEDAVDGRPLRLAVASELDGSIVLITPSRYPRPDVVAALGDATLATSGFRAYVSRSALSSGSHVIMPAWLADGECTLGAPFVTVAV